MRAHRLQVGHIRFGYCLVLRVFSFEGPALKLKYGPIAQLVRAHA